MTFESSTKKSKKEFKGEQLKVRRGPKAKFIVTEEILDEVIILAGKGLTNKQIFAYYEIENGMGYRLLKRYPELDLALRKGKAKTISYVTGKLMEQIKKGNLTAIIFYLKTQAGFSDKEGKDEEDESKPSLSITITDPVEAARIYQQIMEQS